MIRQKPVEEEEEESGELVPQEAFECTHTVESVG